MEGEELDEFNHVEIEGLHKCTDCDYQCERKISLVKHFNTKHRKILKCDQCGDMFQVNNAMESHIVKEHSGKLPDKTEPSIQTIEKVSEVVSKNVKCDKCNSGFTSKMALSQHMLKTHTPNNNKTTTTRGLMKLQWGQYSMGLQSGKP